MLCPLFLVAMLSLPSCAGVSAQLDPDPVDALEAWVLALEEGRPGDAWDLLAPEAREGLSEADFEGYYAGQREELLERARGILRWARTHPAIERAEVEVGSQRVQLVRLRGGWRILGSPSSGGE